MTVPHMGCGPSLRGTARSEPNRPLALRTACARAIPQAMPRSFPWNTRLSRRITLSRFSIRLRAQRPAGWPDLSKD